MTQLDLMDAMARKDEGMKRAAESSGEWLKRMRSRARIIARIEGEVCADRMRLVAEDKDDHPGSPNAWGSLFSGGDWEAVGYRKSEWPSARARVITIWRLADVVDG